MSDSSFFKNVGSTASFDVVAVSETLLAQVENATEAAASASSTLEQIQGIAADVEQRSDEASLSATEAAGSAAAASSARATAQTNADTAQTRAVAADASATAAASSAAAASASKVAAGDFVSSLLSSHTEFSTLYLGSYATAPTQQTNGDPLEDGNQYLDTSTTPHSMQIYDAAGGTWRPLISPTAHRTRTLYVFTVDAEMAASHQVSGVADSGQTLGFTEGNYNVFVNGVLMIPDVDFTTAGTTTINIALTTSLSVGDHVIVEVFSNFSLDDHVSGSDDGRFHGNVDFAGNTAFQGNVAFQGQTTIQGNLVSQAGSEFVLEGPVTAAGATTFTGGTTVSGAAFTVTGATSTFDDITAADITAENAEVTGANGILRSPNIYAVPTGTLPDFANPNQTWIKDGLVVVGKVLADAPNTASYTGLVVRQSPHSSLYLAGSGAEHRVIFGYNHTGEAGVTISGGQSGLQVGGRPQDGSPGAGIQPLTAGSLFINDHGATLSDTGNETLTTGVRLTKTGLKATSATNTTMELTRTADASVTDKDVISFTGSSGTPDGSVANTNGGVRFRTSNVGRQYSLGPDGLRAGDDPWWPVPTGTILDYAGDGVEPPEGFLYCQGQAIPRDEYSDLFAVIGITYGDGGPGAATETHFRVPDLRGRVAVGKGDGTVDRLPSSINEDVIGSTGGLGLLELVEANLPAHTHSGTTSTIADHVHGPGTYQTVNDEFDTEGSDHDRYRLVWGTAQTETFTLDVTGQSGAAGGHSHTFTTSSIGSGTPIETLQPSLVVNKIIKF